MPPTLTNEAIDWCKDAILLDLAGITDEELKALFRQVKHCPERQRALGLSFRDTRFLIDFAGALELAAYDRTNWAIIYPAAIMLIVKYKLR